MVTAAVVPAAVVPTAEVRAAVVSAAVVPAAVEPAAICYQPELSAWCCLLCHMTVRCVVSHDGMLRCVP